MELKEVIKDNNRASISHCVAGVIYYTVKVDGKTYQFPIDMNDKDDVGTATFPVELKAITLMRYIRKAIEKEEFVKID